MANDMRVKGHFSFLLLFIIVHLFTPLPARAACCVCTSPLTNDFSNPSVCFVSSDESGCNGERELQRTVATRGGTGVNVRVVCEWRGADECSAAALKCPNVKQETKISAIIGNVLGLPSIAEVEREAIEFTPQVSIPGTDFQAGKPITGGITAATLGKYIAGIYTFVIASIGILAVVGIMIAGFQYLLAAGSPEKISNAKSSIASAVIGLIIALTSFLLFSTINPNGLVDFSKSLSTLTDVQSKQLAAIQAGGSGCGTPADIASYNQAYLGDIYSVPGGSVQLQRATADLLQKAANIKVNDVTLSTWLTNTINGSIKINDGYRSLREQAEFYECYQWRIKDDASMCPYACTSCNDAAVGSCTAPHVAGFAVDICLETTENIDMGKCGTAKNDDKPGFNTMAGMLQQYMKAAGFERYCNEWWHFEPAGIRSGAVCEPGEYR